MRTGLKEVPDRLLIVTSI